jgi:hypothetical protein
MLPAFAPPGAPNPEDLVKFYAEGSKMNYAMVQNGVVVNVIDWDGVASYTPPEGCELHAWEGPINIGWAWVAGAPVDPSPSPSPSEPATLPDGGGPAVL